MKVVFAIPALTGELRCRCHQSLVATYRILNRAGIEYDELFIENCPYLPVARATLVAMFMADKEATDLFFVDSDVAFDPSAVTKILERPEGIVAGVYPLKRDFPHGYPVELKLVDGKPFGVRIGGPRDYLVEANFLPTGFMRVKRIVFEALAKAYPELKYEQSVVEVMGAGVTEAYDFFGMGAFGRKFRTEDFAFCQRWRDIKGRLWIMPDINFEHIGTKGFKGNLQQFLLRQPGGAKDLSRVARYIELPGWMNLEELSWLVEEATKHQRIVELGSYLGRSTRALGENTPGKVWAVDDWKGPREVDWESSETLYDKFCANVKDLMDAGKVLPIRADHSEVPVFYMRPDMVFVDGDHAYESVCRDIRIWKERLEPGGLLCGHDFDLPDVKRAVEELLPGAACAPETQIWYWSAPVWEASDERDTILRQESDVVCAG
mgnify:FL=1